MVGQLQYINEDFDGAYESFQDAKELLDAPIEELDLRLAELHLRAGELSEALSASSDALEQDPNNVSLIIMRAGILDALEQNDEAISYYKRAIAEEPELIDSYILLSSLYIKVNRPEQAVGLLSPLVKLSPNRPIIHYYLARALEHNGQLTPAQKHYRRALELAPGEQDVSRDVVRVLVKENKIDEAQKFCEAILETSPDDVTTRRILSQLLLGENRIDQALEQLVALEAQEEDPTETRFKIALIQIQRRQYLEAFRELNLVLSQRPDHYEARYYLGTVYASSGYSKEAVDEFIKIPSEAESYLRARSFAVFLLRQSGDLKRAEKIAFQALKVPASDDRDKLVTYLVVVLRESDKYDEALDLINSEIKTRPTAPELWFDLAVVQSEYGLNEESFQSLERVLQLDPQHSEAMNFLAYSLAEADRELPRALKLIEQAIHIRPNDGFYLDTLGWIQYRTGELVLAEGNLKRAVELTGSDPVIMEHYADSLVALRKYREGYQVYRRIVENLDESAASKDSKELIDRVERKIAELTRKNPELANNDRAESGESKVK